MPGSGGNSMMGAGYRATSLIMVGLMLCFGFPAAGRAETKGAAAAVEDSRPISKNDSAGATPISDPGFQEFVIGKTAASEESVFTLVETQFSAPRSNLMAAVEKAAAEPVVQHYCSFNPADLKMPSPGQMYTSYFKQAADMSRGNAK